MKANHPGSKNTHWKVQDSESSDNKIYLHLSYNGYPVSIKNTSLPDGMTFQELFFHHFLQGETITLCDEYYIPSSPQELTFDSLIYKTSGN